jgi:GH25 family lysozyme M1 (1,4-beta-N-acetylmuramidase)
VKAHGYKPCIYANTSTLNSNLTNPKYPVWVAQYNSTCTYKGSKVMWQYTSKGRVDGITASSTNNGVADVDLSYVYE